jgi:hypothetical protein
MKWAALDVDRESDPGWFEIPADLRGHHRALIVACSRYENSGIIQGCRPWSGKRWWAFAGVKRQTIERLVALKLALWLEDGASLQVAHYDLYAESHVKNLRAAGRKGAKVRWEAHARAIAEAAAGVDGGPPGEPPGGPPGEAPAMAMRPSPSPSPSGSGAPPPTALGESPLPSPEGGAGGGGRGGEGSPHGVDETGPEGFERWWAAFTAIRWCAPYWRPMVMDQWIALDLEGDADEIIAYCRWHYQHTPKWRRRGPNGPYAPTPRELLKGLPWRKRGPWNSAAAAPPRPRSSETQPEVLNAGMVDVTPAKAWLDQLLSDPEIDEQTKERHKREWIREHPGQLPPWPNGRAS